jgi:NAD(P) transhydrogenase subunit alpha
MAHQASQLYGTNLCHLMQELGGSQNYTVDFENEVVRGALILHEGAITYPPPRKEEPKPEKKPDSATVTAAQPVAKTAPTPASQPPAPAKASAAKGHGSGASSPSTLWLVLIGCALIGIGISAPESFLSHFTVFVLACFVGWQVIWNVKPALHTPLMSVTNAISGIIIIGGMLQLAGPTISATTILGAIAILIGTINIAGGFLVTQRMLKMFQK